MTPISDSNIIISLFSAMILLGIGTWFAMNYIDKKVKYNPYYIKDFLLKHPDLSFSRVAEILGVNKWLVSRIAKKNHVKSKFKFGGDRIK